MSLIYFKDDVESVYDQLGNEFGDIGNLGKHSDEVKVEIEKAVKIFDKEKNILGKNKDIYYWEYNGRFPLRSIIATLYSSKHKDKTIIISSKKDDIYVFSARRQDKKVNVAELLQRLVEGFENGFAGGHIPAAGGHFPEKYYQKFMQRLENID